jgi:hypothetical protein
MALTGKTIGELTALDYTTNNLLLPVEEAGTTYHIPFSGINYTESTYSGLTIGSSTGNLVVGQYYLMTDFQTCYDQPNYTNEGIAITTGNYKTGTTEPILLLATSTTGFSPTVYSTLYPNDKLTYDFTWDTTEVTSSPAKGRITERIDRFNNRADYDFRAVRFIRYQSFFSERYYDGTVSIDNSGNVVGVGTDFDSSFSVGQILGIFSPNYSDLIGGFAYYEILTISGATNMTVTGTTYYTESNKFYSRGSSSGYASPFQCNVPTSSYTGFTQYYTFDFDNYDYFNNYLGDNQDYDTFILSNNVFLGGTYINNTFGGNVVGNTFYDDDMDSNTCGSFFQYNIITNDFDDNTIGPEFTFNFIDCDMQGNSIVGSFEYNMLGDDDGFDFDFNEVGWGFRNNFLTFYDDDFRDNKIGNDFVENLIHYSFSRNIISDNFNTNTILESFDENEIGNSFYSNIIKSNFTNNKVGSLFNNNGFYSSAVGNIFGDNSFGNTFGEPNNASNFDFQNNQVGSDMTNNYFSGDCLSNVIGNSCQSNDIDTNFSYNRIGSGFQSNTIANDFGFGGGTVRGNVVGNGFLSNIIGEYCYDNTFGDNCYNNIVSDNFTNNKISHGFNNCTINDIDTVTGFMNNTISYGNFSDDLTLSGGTGGNPIFYSSIPTNVTVDAGDLQGYVTFLSGGTFVAQPTII